MDFLSKKLWPMRFAVVLLGFLLIGWLPQSDVWEVFLLGLPSSITPQLYNSNMGIYILRQTHAPLFKQSSAGEYYSPYLNYWKRGYDYRTFEFCLKPGVEFYHKRPLTISYLSMQIKKILDQKKVKGSIKLYKSCVEVILDHSYPELLFWLSRYQYAPSLPHNDFFEWGIGDYYPVYYDRKKIILQRKHPQVGKINLIYFYDYQKNPKGLGLATKKDIDDYNRLFLEDIPKWVKQNYEKSYVPLLQTVDLVINIPNREARSFFYHCISIPKLLRAFRPDQKQFYHLSSPIPVGLPGGNSGEIKQSCDKKWTKVAQNKDWVFTNWNSKVTNSLKKFWKGVEQQFGVKVKVKEVQLSEFVDMALTVPHTYDLTILAIDGVEGGSYDFFKCLIDDKRIIDQKYVELKKWVDQLVINDNSIEDISHFIMDQAIILPLYQEVRPFYFPKNYKDLKINGNYLGQPNLGELNL